TMRREQVTRAFYALLTALVLGVPLAGWSVPATGAAPGTSNGPPQLHGGITIRTFYHDDSTTETTTFTARFMGTRDKYLDQEYLFYPYLNPGFGPGDVEVTGLSTRTGYNPFDYVTIH